LSELSDLSIIKVIRYVCNLTQGKKIIVVLELEVLHHGDLVSPI
jgi:hypothetical protein